METNADPIYSADCWRNENLPYRGWGEGGVVRISVIADQVLYHDQTWRLFSIEAVVVRLEFEKKRRSNRYYAFIFIFFCEWDTQKKS